MTYENRKNQRIKKRKIRNIIIISIFSLLLAKSAYGIIAKTPKTTLPKEEDYIISTKALGVMIKDEKVYDIEGNIELNPLIEEGKRVSLGFEIGKVNIVGDIRSLSEELDELNKAVNQLTEKANESKLFISDKETLESSQEVLMREIQRKINEKDYASIGDLKNQILANDEKLSDVSLENTLLSQSLESLTKKRDTIIDEINNSSTSYYTQQSGVISFEIDGYENIYIPKEFENYTYDKIQIPESKMKSGTTEKEDKLKNKYKIINNFNWQLAIKIDNIENVGSYELGDTINLKIADNDRELVGRIIAINESNGKAVFIVEFNSYLFDYYNQRFSTIEILLKKQDAYLIPTKSIVDNNGQKGVYIKEFNGIVRFKPIEILGEKDDYTFVSKGDTNRYIKLNTENQVRTISLYDEILINPWNFDEGDILN